MTLRRAAAVAATLAMALVVIPATPAVASGGGGCGEPVTSETGSEIAIEGFCFTPTVLYTEVGDTVTWTNQDPFRHNVSGANAAWGSYATFRKRRPASYSFTEAGVYSYVCTVHPGMVGTVVVGDPVPGESLSADAVHKIKTLSASGDEPAGSDGASDGASIWLAAAAVAAGGGLLAIGRVRRRSRSDLP